ncbi:hypothetical protein M433DRAFT_527620 [Acidomyces richmondensis BFW]|nr:MAG: hypothetical protein FE78DRAFT_282319 [Acidomyces sp. 'richmondensis']KYG46981.1 hypothetical protein M433DRAFT_527620 [Acidomyces richmondensis BFW]
MPRTIPFLAALALHFPSTRIKHQDGSVLEECRLVETRQRRLVRMCVRLCVYLIEIRGVKAAAVPIASPPHSTPRERNSIELPTSRADLVSYEKKFHVTQVLRKRHELKTCHRSLSVPVNRGKGIFIFNPPQAHVHTRKFSSFLCSRQAGSKTSSCWN